MSCASRADSSPMASNRVDFLRDTELNLESISFVALLRSIISEIDIPDEIKINLPTNDAVLEVDIMKMTSLFDNLILNAIQAMNNNGIITIRVSELNDVAQIEIEDDGPAIPEENIDKIFEPLFTTKQKGTGLGLASCKNIVKQHGGTLSVTNNPVIFVITLPMNLK